MSQFIEMFGNPVTNTKGWKTAKIKDVAPEMPSKEQLSGKIWLLNLDMIESNTGRIIEKVYEDVENALSVQSFDEGNVLFSKLRPYLNKVVIPDEPGMATTELVPLRPEPSKLHISPFHQWQQVVSYKPPSIDRLPIIYQQELFVPLMEVIQTQNQPNQKITHKDL